MRRKRQTPEETAMQEKDVKDLPGGVAWTGVADRKDEVQEESWYQVWGRGLWAEIRSDAWYLEAMLYAIFLILLTWGKCSGELSALSETTVFDAMVRCPAQLLLMPKINQSSAHQHARTISSSEYGRVGGSRSMLSGETLAHQKFWNHFRTQHFLVLMLDIVAKDPKRLV